MGKSIPSTSTAAVFAKALESLHHPSGPRAVMVWLDHKNQPQVKPVAQGQSVLRLQSPELFDHLSAEPCDSEFLQALRDYAEGRLAARAEARRSGGVVISRGPGRWEIAHVNAFDPNVQVL